MPAPAGPAQGASLTEAPIGPDVQPPLRPVGG